MKSPLRRYFVLALLLLSSSAHISMSWIGFDYDYGILSPEDQRLELTQEEPVLESTPGEMPHWQSFNRWLCFPTTTLKVGCFDEKSDARWETSDPEKREDRGFYSVMHLDHAGMLYRFESPEWTIPERCNEEAARIRELIKDQEGICVFAAYLPTIEHPEPSAEDEEQTWVYYGLKTKSGRDMASIYDEDAADDDIGDSH